MFIFRLFLSFVKHFWLPDCLVVSHSGVIAVLILTYLTCIPKIFLWIGEIFPIFISFITPKQKRCRQIPIKTAQIDSSMNAYRKETPDKQKSAFFIPERPSEARLKGIRKGHQEIICNQVKEVQTLHTPSCYQQLCHWINAIKLLTRSSLMGHFFMGTHPLFPPLPGKAIKLFFSTSPQTVRLNSNSLSQTHSAPMWTGQAPAISILRTNKSTYSQGYGLSSGYVLLLRAGP